MEIILTIVDDDRVRSAYASAYGWPVDADDMADRIKAVLIQQIEQLVEQVEDAAIITAARQEHQKAPLSIE